MKTLFLTEFRRYRLPVAIVVTSVVVFAILSVMMEVKYRYSFSVLGFAFLLSLLTAFVSGRMYDYEHPEFRFLCIWPQSRLGIFASLLLSHLALAVGTVAAVYLVAAAALLLQGEPFGTLAEESVLNPTSVRAISLYVVVFAFSAFWSQFTGSLLSLLMTLISIIAVRFFLAAAIEGAFRWRLQEQHLSKVEMFGGLHAIPAWAMIGLAVCIIAAAAVGFVHVPLLEVKRRALSSYGIAAVVFVLLGLLLSLEHTNWLGFSEVRYQAVQIGMDRPTVAGILGAPHQRYLRSALGPGLSDYIHPPSAGREQPPNGQHEARLRGDEVWRWWYPIDQKTYVVFDRNGRVIFKWIDY